MRIYQIDTWLQLIFIFYAPFCSSLKYFETNSIKHYLHTWKEKKNVFPHIELYCLGPKIPIFYANTISPTVIKDLIDIYLCFIWYIRIIVYYSVHHIYIAMYKFSTRFFWKLLARKHLNNRTLLETNMKGVQNSAFRPLIILQSREIRKFRILLVKFQEIVSF